MEPHLTARSAQFSVEGPEGGEGSAVAEEESRVVA